jgi:subtilisin family serine protease
MQPWEPRRPEPGRGVRVAVLDTRIYPHPWLEGGYLATSRALVQPAESGSAPGIAPPLPKASEGHATFVAGLILRRAPGAQLHVQPVLGDDELGNVWDVARKMADLAGSGVDIMNLSLGCYTDDGNPPLVLTRAVGRLTPEIVLVAAAGNHGNVDQLCERLHKNGDADSAAGLHSTTPVWPAALADVIAVGAVDGSGHVAPFSPRLPWVDLAAPGVHVESTYLTGRVRLEHSGKQSGADDIQEFHGIARWSGTSFAAASVTGAIAAGVRPGHRSARAVADSLLDKPHGDIAPCRLTTDVTQPRANGSPGEGIRAHAR